MSLIKNLLGRSDFKPASSIIESLSSFPSFNFKNEDLLKAEALLVFKSQFQQCWLVFTSEGMYFVVDDTEKGETKVLWERERVKMILNERFDLSLKIEPQSNETSKVLFGNMNKSFLFTKSLFKNESITGLILKLVSKHFSV